MKDSKASENIERVKKALTVVRQYQRDWVSYGSNRVYLYFTDVEGDWLDHF